MRIRILLIITALVLVHSCGSSKDRITDEDRAQLEAIIAKDVFHIESQWAYPQNVSAISNTGLLPPESGAGNINLIGNYNFFKKNGDSIAVELPFFGIRQLGGTYDTDNVGYRFKGIPDEAEYSYKKGKGLHQYQFEVNNNTENLQFYIKIFANLRAEIRVNSTHRSSIRYRGNLVLQDQ